MPAATGSARPTPWYALSGKPQSVDLAVGPATDTSFLVIGPDGRPVAGAVVEPDLIFAPNNCHMNPPAAMLPAIRSITDATGRAALPAIAAAGVHEREDHGRVRGLANVLPA